MFQIKICGITNLEDALAAVESGADAIGLNFCEGSPRCVDVPTAREIAEAVPSGVYRVGVFVNAPAEWIRTVFSDVGLDAVQLHGDETPEQIERLPELPFVKAYRVDGRGLTPIQQQLARLHDLGRVPEMVLFDARTPSHYGGTGKTFDWQIAYRFTSSPAMPPLVLAGGLNPGNVAEAIHRVQPQAVDVASGVEERSGRKSRELMFQFVENARSAWTDR